MVVAPVGKWAVHVSIKSGSTDEERFIELLDVYKTACLAPQLVHSDPSRAWVRFSDDSGAEESVAFLCADLELVNITQQG